MSTNLGELLDTARRERFVGRRRELTGFENALAGRSTRRVLFVHGQGGIGKTTLLQQFRARSQAAGRNVVYVDGRDVDPSPEGMRTAVRGAVDHRDDRRSIVDLLIGAVLLVDGYEQLTAIDGWLRDDLMPRLSADAVVVLAGRDPPAAPWRTDPGWRQLLAVHHLDPFDPAESGQLLANAGVVPPARPHLVRLGRGHPLTMALLADLAASGQVPDTLADVPDLISTLLESFLRDVPSDAHLTGLATCAIAWLTTEDLLAQLVGGEAAAVWRWLAGLPFITAGPRGLSAHDLTRDVLDAEFERRAPRRYGEYHRIIYAHTVADLRAGAGPNRQLHAQQLFFLLRNSPLTAAVSALRARGSATVAAARPDDHDLVCAIIERFQGAAGAQLARAWLSAQPEHLSMVRAGDDVTGFAYHVVCPGGSGLEDRDPVVRGVLDHVAREGPLRPGERVGICRFWAGARRHQRDPYAMLAGSVSHLIELVARPFAWSVFIVVETEDVGSFMEYWAFSPLFEVGFGGIRHVAYGIDWRRLPIDAWLDLMRVRARSGETGPPPAGLLRPPPLDRTRFAAAVKTALQTLHRPDQLAANPLLGSALAATATGPDAGRLRTTIVNAVAHLGDQPRGEQVRTVLHRTYLHAAPTQEAAAEVLHLSLSTYRRYLAKALEQLTDLLWTIEVGDLHLPARSGGAEGVQETRDPHDADVASGVVGAEQRT